MPFHAFFGIALMSMSTVLATDWYDQLGRTWGASAVARPADRRRHRLGRSARFPTLIVLLALAFQWWRDDDRMARRADRRADAAAARDGRHR